ncbi:MAG: fructose bisphosphate aldolase, partial [Tsuneonella sp.]
MNHQEMTDRIATGQGFIAALDQSGGSTPKALRGYGLSDDAWTGEDEMFAAIHAMRERIVESPCFGNGKVLGAILFEKTMDGASGGKPVPERLKERGIVP